MTDILLNTLVVLVSVLSEIKKESIQLSFSISLN